jgi:hypothetical protein
MARAHKIWLRALGFVIAVLPFDNASLRAQMQVGSETQLSLQGSISAGYAGSMTNNDEDSHGLVFGGVGNLGGSVYSPQFLSFDVVPFYNQSRNNSSYQSITDSSGVTATANLFGGSQFPGYLNYSRVYNNTTNNYVIPGLANYATNGDTQTFGVGWSANLTNLPFLSFAYQQGSSNYSLLGTQQESFSDFHSVSGSANYNVDGWHLNGGIHYLNTDSIFPQFLPGTALERATGDNTTYTFNMSRAVDGDGNTWLNFIRTGTDYNYSGLSESESSDVVNGGVTLKATRKLTTTVSGNYIDNLWGSIFQQVTSTGATVPVSASGGPSYSWSFFGNAQYAVLPGLYVEAIATHQQQSFGGTSYSANAYGGSVFYGRQLLGGQFSAGATVTESSYGTEGGFHVGLLANATYIRRIGEWNLSGNVGYSRDTQTILIAYTSSGYSYSVSVNRRIIDHVYWNATANASKSTLDQSSAYSTLTQGYSTGLASRWLSVNGAYAKSSGNGLLTPTGVTPLPPGVPPVLVPTVLYGGRTYSVSVGSTPIRGLTFSGAFIDSRSNTAGSLVNSNNISSQAYAYLTYQVRKIYFDAGYSRLLQGFGASGLPPSLLSTYYVGLSRWFKAF